MGIILNEPAEVARALPMDPVMFGVVAMVAFLALLGVTLAFRNIGHRH